LEARFSTSVDNLSAARQLARAKSCTTLCSFIFVQKKKKKKKKKTNLPHTKKERGKLSLGKKRTTQAVAEEPIRKKQQHPAGRPLAPVLA
jgi:hypothetical protein